VKEEGPGSDGVGAQVYELAIPSVREGKSSQQGSRSHSQWENGPSNSQETLCPLPLLPRTVPQGHHRWHVQRSRVYANVATPLTRRKWDGHLPLPLHQEQEGVNTRYRPLEMGLMQEFF
jgi:hypothetical protein